MSDGCARCALLTVAVQDAEAGATEMREQRDALTRALTAERRRADRIEAKLHREQTEAEDAKTIRACLKVWEDCCWAGSKRPSLDINGQRADRVRKALQWAGIEPLDVQDALRGLGLLPYEGPYGARSTTLKSGFKRKADVDVALRDDARLERFRDYYRRVQATPADRLREQWEQASGVADLLFIQLLRARRLEDREQEQEQASQRGHLFVVPDPESEAA